MSLLILLQRKMIKKMASTTNLMKKEANEPINTNEFKIKAKIPINFKINEILYVLTDLTQR